MVKSTVKIQSNTPVNYTHYDRTVCRIDRIILK